MEDDAQARVVLRRQRGEAAADLALVDLQELYLHIVRWQIHVAEPNELKRPVRPEACNGIDTVPRL